MGSFVEDLWSSVFTPGPTPSLLIATNVTFAALQVLLLALLLATYSIHFVVLSILSAALWWSINWFAQELSQVQAQEAPKETHEDKERRGGSTKPAGALESSDSDTETEVVKEKSKVSAATGVATSAAPTTASTSATLHPPPESQARKRLSVSGDSSGYHSTDSEWEKVDDNNGP
jgi:cytoskeletal protein RodZ